MQFVQRDDDSSTLYPNRPISILITVFGATLFSVAAFDLLQLNREGFLLCLFFGLILLAGGVVLLLVRFEVPNHYTSTSYHELLADPEYEEAFKIVVSDQSTRGAIDESSIQRGTDYLVAHGVAPDEAWEKLREILKSYAEQTSQE